MTPPSPLELAVEALEPLAAQLLSHEMRVEDYKSADFEGAYDACVEAGRRAASALAAIRQEGVRSYPVAEGAARSVDAAMAEAKLAVGWRAAIKAVALDVLPPIFALETRIAYAEAIAFSARLDTYDGTAPPTRGWSFVAPGRHIFRDDKADAPPTDRAGPSATDYDPKPFIGGYFTDRVNAGDRSNIAGAAHEYGDEVPSTPPPDRGADVEAVRALFLTYDRANDAAWSEDGKLVLVENPSRKRRDVVRDAFNKAKDEREVFLAALDRLAAPGWRPTHRHVKRGTDYQVIAFGAIQAADPVADETEVTIYLAGNGAYYVRPTAEFNDGRFLALKPPPPTDEMR